MNSCFSCIHITLIIDLMEKCNFLWSMHLLSGAITPLSDISLFTSLVVDILIKPKSNPPSNCLIIQVKIVLVVIFATTIEFYMKMNPSTFTDIRAPFTMPTTATTTLITLGFKAYQPSVHLILSQFQKCNWSFSMIVVKGCGEDW